jgi:hypothetical protein
VNPNLLEIVALTPESNSKQLTLEDIQVNPELAPFLISSMRSVTWVPHASKKNTVRTGVRHREGIESELVAAVVEMGSEMQWGNVHPLSTEGIQSCLEHVSGYIDSPLEILYNTDTDMEGIDIPEHFQQTPAKWVPVDCVVVVPVDRSYLGTLWVLGSRVAALIHNVARGVAVAWR